MGSAAKLGRAALLGLAAGLALAAAGLGVQAALLTRSDCAGLLPEECAFEQQLSRNLARLQGLGALGCALVSGGLFLRLRAGHRKVG